MDNIGSVPPESEPEKKPETKPESTQTPATSTETGLQGYINENITRVINRFKTWLTQVKRSYRQAPRLQKAVYQGKFTPAFWTITALFSLLVNIIFIAFLVHFGHYFFELKTLLGGQVREVSSNLTLMDQAHIVTTVPVETTVQLQDNIPVEFDLSINQRTQLSLAENTQISGAYIYLNNTAVQTDLTLPAGTPIQVDLNMTIPVSQSVPVDVTVPVSLLVPLDVAVDQTDLHQSIVGLQGAIEPFNILLASEFNSPEDFPLCNRWWSGWLCNVFFGKP
jgi:hypothetical protein